MKTAEPSPQCFQILYDIPVPRQRKDVGGGGGGGGAHKKSALG